jgi:DNA-3-methyladenine glycosylase
MKLARSFYCRNTKTVARELLGKILVHRTKMGILKGRIVETEAYFGKNDPGSHAFKGITPRNAIMYRIGGTVYTYFTYGNHWMLNAVTDKEGKPGAVLVRALEPLEGIEIMKKLRNTDKIENLCSGPGKLTQAMDIDKKHNGMDLTGNELLIEDSKEKHRIVKTTRIGLSMGGELPLRFYIKDSKFVSRK